MSWTCDFTADAKADLQALPRSVQKRVARVVTGMETDPFQGDVKALAGPEWAGVFRRRMGSYRLLFSVDRGKQKVFILHILLRSGKTYR